jgi:PKD repeat protein
MLMKTATIRTELPWGRLLLRVAPVVLVAMAMPACEDLPSAPNVPPTAEFVYSPISPIIAGSTAVTFNASGSRDSDGSISSYTFDFGDGTPPVTGPSATVTHVYPNKPARCVEFVYAALLTVADDKGDTGTASQQVTVIELPNPQSSECQ